MPFKRPLLIYPHAPWDRSEHLYGGLTKISPIGLEVIGTVCRPLCEDVYIADMRLETHSLEQICRTFRPDLVGVSLQWGNHDYIDEVMWNRLPAGVPVVAGGLWATRKTEEVLARYPRIEAVFTGYAEQAFKRYVQSGAYCDLPGVVYRHNGGLVRNEGQLPVDVSAFRVDRSLRRVKYPFMRFEGDFIATSIGCPSACRFCKWRENIYGCQQRWIGRSPESVVDELAEMSAEMIYIVDANFAADMDRVERICDLIIERDIRKLFIIEIRVNSIVRGGVKVLRKMEQAGFFMFLVGIESPQTRLLKAMRKGFTQRTVRRAFDILRHTHIFTLGNFLIGNIGESEPEMLYIADFAHELGVDVISPNKLYAYKDSEFREMIEATDGYHIDPGSRGYVLRDDRTLADMRRIQAQIYLRFLKPDRLYRSFDKLLAHPMITKIGRGRFRHHMMLAFFDHVLNPKWAKRLMKKFATRFGGARRDLPPTADRPTAARQPAQAS
jgi:radical SAM superfamily enzyme YgiQ (UPF0313 family)